MDKYPERMDKMALCIESAMLAKNAAVKEFGIGEELPFTLFGWRDSSLVAVATLDNKHMNDPVIERTRRIATAGAILRQAWAVTEFGFLAEGFVSTDGSKTNGKPLREAFLEPDSGVSECLTVALIGPRETELITKAYTVGFGRKVTWGAMSHTTDLGLLRESVYVNTLQRMLELNLKPAPADPEHFYELLAKGLAADGVVVQWNL